MTLSCSNNHLPITWEQGPKCPLCDLTVAFNWQAIEIGKLRNRMVETLQSHRDLAYMAAHVAPSIISSGVARKADVADESVDLAEAILAEVRKRSVSQPQQPAPKPFNE